MSYRDVNSALSRIQRKKTPKSIDILFHPGGITDKKNIDWTKNEAFLNYYSSADRRTESKVLKRNEFKSLIEKYETIFNN